MLVEHLDLVLKLLHAVKGFVRLLQTVLVERLHAHEDRDTTTLGRQLDHLRVVAQEQRGLASPLNLERLERLPQLPAVAPVAVMQVIHEREDGSVLQSDPDTQPGHERLPQGPLPHPLHQLSANPLLDAGQLLDDFRHRPAAGGLPVEGRDAAELAFEVAAPRRKAALPGHVGIRAQELHLRADVVLQRRELRHLIHPLHRPGLEVRHQLRPEILGFATHDRVAVPEGFVGAVRRVHPAQDHLLAAFPKLRGDLVRARRVAGHDRQADQVAGPVEVDVLDRFIHEVYLPVRRRVRRNHR